METPPLTRGRHESTLRASERDRNTPAYAGKTDGMHQVEPNLYRNTPAYAGKTSGVSTWTAEAKKHPRLRGEDIRLFSELVGEGETPPLTRGRQIARRASGIQNGNTPAYAGKTVVPEYGETEPEKHPRLRGEDPLPRAAPRGGRETPPLTRGRRLTMRALRRTPRNTPAYAGKTATFVKC